VAKQIVILEDNRERREAMARFLADRLYSFEPVFFESPQPMLAYLRERLGDAICITLDHDMELIDDGAGRLIDPGSGREVAEFLARHRPQCPVVLHTTNTVAAEAMTAMLTEAGWQVYRVAPWGNLEWVHEAWGRTVRRAIVDTAQPLQDRSPNGALPATSPRESAAPSTGTPRDPDR
jgi:CheY-like chemotaxis protein